MQDANPTPKTRRDFLAMAATATAGLGVTLPLAGTAAAATGPSTEFTRWLDSIPGKYKQVTDWPDLNHGMGLIYTFSFLITAPAAYGVPETDTGAVLVIRQELFVAGLVHGIPRWVRPWSQAGSAARADYFADWCGTRADA